MEERNAWKESLAAVACRGTGALCLSLPQLGRGLALPSISRAGIEIFVGLLLLSYPSLVRRLSLAPWTQRAAPLLALLGGMVSGTWGWGWPPGAVLFGSLLVAFAGLLVGRIAVAGVLFAEAVALLWGSRAAGSPAVAESMRNVDPTLFINWLTFATMFAACAVVLAAVLSRASRHVGQAFEKAREDQVLAEVALKVSRELQHRRFATELGLRDTQKLQALGQLSGGLAHLLNNALMVVRGVLEDLESKCSLELRSQFESNIVQSCKKVAASIRQLMVFSRQSPKALERIDLLAEAEKIALGFRATLPEDVELSVRGAQGQFVELENNRFKQLLLNLLLNAVDALRHGGRLRVTVQAPSLPSEGPQGCRLVVEDDGFGMPTSVAARALDAFYTTKHRSAHAGLGLTVAAGIAEHSGGWLQLESSKAVGTRVTVSFPNVENLENGETSPLMLEDLDPPSSASPALEENSPTITPTDYDRNGWKSAMSRQLARWGLPTGIAVMVIVLAMPSGYQMKGLIAVGFLWVLPTLAVAGWLKTLTSEWRTIILIASMVGLSVLEVLGTSYLMAGLTVCLLLGVAWSALLATSRTTYFLIATLFVVLLGIGLIQPSYSSFGIHTGSDFAAPGNWMRLAFSLPLCQFVLVFSVLAILKFAQRATNTASVAKRDMEEAQAQEQLEGRKMLALAQGVSRTERLSATGQAVGCVAHDLNNALQALMGPAAFLSDPDLTEEELQVARQELQLGFEHASGFAAQFSVEDDSVTVLTTVPSLLLRSAIEPAVGTIQALLGSDYHVEVQSSDSGAVAIPESALRRILFNLITNARDALNGKGQIFVKLEHIKLEDMGDQVILEVMDRGKGMDEQTLARVVEPFFTTKPEGKGTGLGLHSVSRMVEQSNGTLAIDSSLGDGTTVRIAWPHSPVEERMPLAAQRAASDTSLQSGSILVVEDEPLIRSLLTRTLRTAGYTVFSADNGNTALELLEKTEKYSALCIDGVIPGASSGTVIETFRRLHPGGSVIVCSGYLPSSLRKRGLLTASVTILSKPFAPQELCSTLRRLASRASRLPSHPHSE